MAFWNRWFSRPKPDRIDGYEPKPPSESDPWKDPALVDAMKKRATEPDDRLDAKEAGDRMRMDAEAYDGFVNEMTGIGSWLKDKTFGGQMGGPTFQTTLLSGVACEDRWRGSDLGGRIVECIPDEMTREGWDLQVQPTDDDEDNEEDKADDFPPQPPGAPGALPGMPPIESGAPKPLEIDDEGIEIAEEVRKKCEELNLDSVLWEALCYERAYGGAAILLGADDGADDLTAPLDPSKVKDITHLTAFRGGWDGEVVAWSYYRDPTKPNYGMPEVYMLRNLGTPVAKVPAPGEKIAAPDKVLPTSGNGYGPLIYWVHESRMLVFPGLAVSRRARTQMRGWGDSAFIRIDRVLQQYDQTWGGIALLMTDFSQGMLKVKGLLEMFGMNNKNKGTAPSSLTARARSIQLTRSIANLLLLDADEEYSRDTATLAGVAEVLQQFALRLAAAADMPVTLLMGQSPAGLNATGASDIRFFYDRIASRQERRLAPQLRRLISLIMQSSEGPTDGVEPERWNLKFRPLYQETAGERADRMLKVAQADHIWITDSVYSPEECAATRFGGADFNDGPVTLDLEGRQEQADQDEKDKAARAKAMLQALKNPPAPAPSTGPAPKPAVPPGKPSDKGS